MTDPRLIDMLKELILAVQDESKENRVKIQALMDARAAVDKQQADCKKRFIRHAVAIKKISDRIPTDREIAAAKEAAVEDKKKLDEASSGVKEIFTVRRVVVSIILAIASAIFGLIKWVIPLYLKHKGVIQ